MISSSSEFGASARTARTDDSNLAFPRRTETFTPMNLAVETEQETDGRWIAEIPQIPGALAYGVDRNEAISRVEALALRVLADRLEHGEMPQELEEVFSVAV